MTETMVLVRALHFASVMAIFGAAGFLVSMRRRLPSMAPDASYFRDFVVGAAALALTTAIASIPLTAAQMEGSWLSALDLPNIGAVLRETRFGQLLIARNVLLIVLLAIGCGRVRSRDAALCAISGTLLVMLAFTSHAAASASSPLFVLVRAGNDAVHLLAGGFWLGGLIVLTVLIGASHGDPARLLPPLRLFSLWGTYAVALIVLSGAANAAFILSMEPTSWRGHYDGLLMLKIVLALCMIGLASINRWRLMPAMADGGGANIRPVARNVAVEFALGLAVVTLAAILGVISPR